MGQDSDGIAVLGGQPRGKGNSRESGESAEASQRWDGPDPGEGPGVCQAEGKGHSLAAQCARGEEEEVGRRRPEGRGQDQHTALSAIGIKHSCL